MTGYGNVNYSSQISLVYALRYHERHPSGLVHDYRAGLEHVLKIRTKFLKIEFNSIFACYPTISMVVISKGVIREFTETHPDAGAALMKWYDEIKAADWQNFSDLKKTFNTADAVGNDRYVFDIKGNQYRLIA